MTTNRYALLGLTKPEVSRSLEAITGAQPTPGETDESWIRRVTTGDLKVRPMADRSALDWARLYVAAADAYITALHAYYQGKKEDGPAGSLLRMQGAAQTYHSARTALVDSMQPGRRDV